MKRTPLRPGNKPLKRGGPIQVRTRLERKTPLAPIGKKAGQRYEEQFNGWHSERLRRRPCDGLPDGTHAPGCRILPHLNWQRGDGKNDPSHVVKRRGRAQGLFFHLVTHSRACHDTFETLPRKEREKMLPLAYTLAWQSHYEAGDLVPEPPAPEHEEEGA